MPELKAWVTGPGVKGQRVTATPVTGDTAVSVNAGLDIRVISTLTCADEFSRGVIVGSGNARSALGRALDLAVVIASVVTGLRAATPVTGDMASRVIAGLFTLTQAAELFRDGVIVVIFNAMWTIVGAQDLAVIVIVVAVVVVVIINATFCYFRWIGLKLKYESLSLGLLGPVT